MSSLRISSTRCCLREKSLSGNEARKKVIDYARERKVDKSVIIRNWQPYN